MMSEEEGGGMEFGRRRLGRDGIGRPECEDGRQIRVLDAEDGCVERVHIGLVTLICRSCPGTPPVIRARRGIARHADIGILQEYC